MGFPFDDLSMLIKGRYMLSSIKNKSEVRHLREGSRNASRSVTGCQRRSSFIPQQSQRGLSHKREKGEEEEEAFPISYFLARLVVYKERWHTHKKERK